MFEHFDFVSFMHVLSLVKLWCYFTARWPYCVALLWCFKLTAYICTSFCCYLAQLVDVGCAEEETDLKHIGLM